MALATAGLVQCVLLIGAADGGAVSLSFMALHAGIVAAVLVPAALVLGPRGDGRAWTAFALGAPIMLALWPDSIRAGDLGTGWIVAISVMLGAGTWAWSRWRLGKEAPIVAACAGTLVGWWILRQRADSALSFDDPMRLVLLGGIAAAALAVTLAAGGLPPGWRMPRPAPSMAVAALGFIAPLALAAAPLAGPPRGAPPPSATRALDDDAAPPPIVLVVLDTVRADHLRRYGYTRETMPELEALVSEGVLQAYRSVANSSMSLSTHASMFTGLYPPRHGAHLAFVDDPHPPVSQLYPLDDSVPTLAELLRDAGYRTVGVASNFGHLSSGFGLGRGFQHYDVEPDPDWTAARRSPWCVVTRAVAHLAGIPGVGPCDPLGNRGSYRGATRITDLALEALDRAGDRPFFLFLNYFDAHYPYRAPRRFERLYRSGGGWPAPRIDWERWRAAADAPDPELKQELIDLYDAELGYVDSELARLFERLRGHPRWRDMTVIVTSDHGFAFGEHGLMGHETHLYDEFIDVPLFIKAPELAGDERDRQRVFQSVDLFPTILAAAGLAAPPGTDGVAWARGRDSLRAWLYNDGHLAERYAAEFDRELRSIETNGYKLVGSTAGDAWLFDLGVDPDESDDLAERRPSLTSRYLELLASPSDRAHRLRVTDEPVEDLALDRLRALGYVR